MNGGMSEKRTCGHLFYRVDLKVMYALFRKYSSFYKLINNDVRMTACTH